MNRRKSLLLVSFLMITALLSFAQDKEIKPRTYKYGKVDPTEFNLKPGGTDSAAAAMVLFDVGRGYFEISPKTGDFAYVFERHTRYKIINKNGYDYGNLELQMYKENGYESSLEQMEGATYNLEDGKMVTSKINKDAKFTEKRDKNYTLKKFALPNVKEGSIIEYKYKIKSDFIFTLMPWYFQRSIPTLYSEYEVTIPEYYRYKVNPGGFVYLNPKQEYTSSSFISNGNSIALSSLKRSYKAENVPGLKSENFITTMEDYVSKVGFELNSIAIPGQIPRDFTSTWPKIVTRLKEEENFGGFLNKKGIFKTILKEQIKAASDPDTLLLQIFNYVKNNIKWNDEERKYTSEVNPKTIFDKKVGNSADISLCLIGLLNEAGIKAYPILLSTRDNGTHPGLPLITEFNSILVLAAIGEKNILLDATDKNHTPGLIGYNNLNHQGLKVDFTENNAEWISLEESRISRKSISYTLTLDKENKLSGKIYVSSSDYEGLRRRDRYVSAANEADFLKDYKEGKPGLSLKNYEIKNLNNPAETLIESMDVEIEDNVEEAGNLAYFTPLLFEQTKENPFKLEERNFPVDFGFPTEEVYRINIELPAGYRVDKGPKNEKIILPDENASFTFLFAAEENRIMVSSRIVIKKAVFTPEEYHQLKELFKNIVRKQAEQIVIKKI